MLTRDNTHDNVYFADARTGRSRLVYSDTDPKYLDYKYDVTFLGHGRFVATSWRDGYATSTSISSTKSILWMLTQSSCGS